MASCPVRQHVCVVRQEAQDRATGCAGVREAGDKLNLSQLVAAEPNGVWGDFVVPPRLHMSLAALNQGPTHTLCWWFAKPGQPKVANQTNSTAWGSAIHARVAMGNWLAPQTWLAHIDTLSNHLAWCPVVGFHLLIRSCFTKYVLAKTFPSCLECRSKILRQDGTSSNSAECAWIGKQGPTVNCQCARAR